MLTQDVLIYPECGSGKGTALNCLFEISVIVAMNESVTFRFNIVVVSPGADFVLRVPVFHINIEVIYICIVGYHNSCVSWFMGSNDSIFIYRSYRRIVAG
ncbi:hypothetical protein D3C73_1317060 [compost metagenome]